MSKVHYIHRRRVQDGQVLNNGGITVAFREVNEGIEYAIAKCSPRDNFSRQLGRIKAEGRLDSTRHCCFAKLSREQFINTVHIMVPE